MRNILVFILLLMIAGCFGQIDEPHYKIYADSDFSLSHKTDLIDALEEWRFKTNDLMQYNISFVEHNQIDTTEEDKNTIYISPHDTGAGHVGWTTRDSNTNGSYIIIAPGISDDDFKAVALHELGHAFGLKHYMQPNLSIMHISLFYDTAHVECADLQAFCDMWGCINNCVLTPELISPENVITIQASSEHENVCSLDFKQAK